MYRTVPMPHLIVAFAEKLFAVDQTTGEIRWRVALAEWGTEPVELAIDEHTVIAACSDHLAFVDYQTGELRKHVVRTDRARGRTVFVLEDDKLFLGNSGRLACYSTAGELLWEQPFEWQGEGAIAIGFPGRVRQADL